MLYNYPEVENYGVKIDTEKYQTLLADVKDWGNIIAFLYNFISRNMANLFIH